MADELIGKVIVLTSGADGIGRECALTYVREGGTVAILDRNFAAAQRTAGELGGGSIALAADVSDGESVRIALAAVTKQFGRIDAVHNNAGISSPSRTLHETTEQEWDDMQRTDVKSVYWTTRFAFEALTASMVGSIGQAVHAAYVASKGAMISLIKALAVDYAGDSIRVNAICPAGVWTPMLERWCVEQQEPDSIRRYLDEIHLLGACPHGDVIADAAVFLLSAKARFMTGCILPVSGGADLGYRR